MFNPMNQVKSFLKGYRDRKHDKLMKKVMSVPAMQDCMVKFAAMKLKEKATRSLCAKLAKKGMTIERYNHLTDYENPISNRRLTVEEMFNDWHYCDNGWDGMLIHNSDDEIRHCNCTNLPHNSKRHLEPCKLEGKHSDELCKDMIDYANALIETTNDFHWSKFLIDNMQMIQARLSDLNRQEHEPDNASYQATDDGDENYPYDVCPKCRNYMPYCACSI